MAHGLLDGWLVSKWLSEQRRSVGGAVVSSLVATGVDVGALVLMVGVFHLAIPVAAFVAASLGAVAGFLMSKFFAFRDPTPVTVSQVARFGCVAAASALLMAASMKWIAVDLHVPYLLAKLVCAAAIFVAWSYPAQRRLVFARRRRDHVSLA